MSNPTLGYWDIRGLSNPIRLLLEYAGQKYDFKAWGPEWFQEKQKIGVQFPNLPYYIDDKQKIAQSGAIIKYLARKHGLSATSENDIVQQDVIDGLMGDLRMAWGVYMYMSPGSLEESKPQYMERIEPALKQLDEYLGKQEYLVGSKVSYNDFIFFEILDANNTYQSGFLDKFANLKKFHARIGGLKGVKEYMQSDRNPKKFNGPQAKWGG